MSDLLEAPFIGTTIQHLNTFQTHTSGGFIGHPYTCANRGDGQHGKEGGDLGILIATHEGWVCPHCSYTQKSAHPMMAAKPTQTAPAFRSFGVSTAQTKETLVRYIGEYEALAQRKPDAAGVTVMIRSLSERLAELSAA